MGKRKVNYIALDTVLPMSSAMYAMLVSTYSKTLDKCCLCSHHNGECGEFARQGKCRAMDKSINEVLVFHDGEIEFATTRNKISKLLEVQQQERRFEWIPETVDDVIDTYHQYEKYGCLNPFAHSLYENLRNFVFEGIVYKLDWYDEKKDEEK